jgi:hypothetical protein
MTYVLAVVPCSTPAFTTSPSGSAPTGATVTLSASASGCAHPTYRFWVQKPGAAWQVVQAYSATSTFSWTDTGMAGVYGLEVDARDAASSASYEAYSVIYYTLNGCSGAGIGASPPSPQTPGPTVTITGSAACPGTPQFRFWVRAPGGQWTVKQDYGSANTFAWSTTGLALGNYGLEVDVRNAGSTSAYERVANLTYALAVVPCTKPTFSADKSSPQATGAVITFTASTSGCANPQYRFWVQKPGHFWAIVQDYSATSTFTWQTPWTGSVGMNGLEVDVRDAAESVSYDAVTNLTYQLNGCSSAGLTATQSGATVTLNGSATCPGTATYEFFFKDSTGWHLIGTGYSTSSSVTWTPAAPGTYTLEVAVRDQNGSDSYEAFHDISFVVT